MKTSAKAPDGELKLLGAASAKHANEPKPSDLIHAVFEIHEPGEPRGVLPQAQPTDERGTVGV